MVFLISYKKIEKYIIYVSNQFIITKPYLVYDFIYDWKLHILFSIFYFKIKNLFIFYKFLFLFLKKKLKLLKIFYLFKTLKIYLNKL